MQVPQTVKIAGVPGHAIEISDSCSDIIWADLGAPKQEFLRAEHRAALSVLVLVAVDSAFTVISGLRSQAPRWMRRSCLEWAFRFAHEPYQLWPRIFIDGPLCLAVLLAHRVGLGHLHADVAEGPAWHARPLKGEW
jgi:UDP-N-acetyl-D-mannosaminuronic acid transferase (WecB/TagA/CpsF family)